MNLFDRFFPGGIDNGRLTTIAALSGIDLIIKAANSTGIWLQHLNIVRLGFGITAPGVARG